MPAIVGVLLKLGLPLIANAFVAKGRKWVKDKTGVDLQEAATNISGADATSLRQYELEHETELMQIQLEKDKIGERLEIAHLADTKSARDMQVAALHQEGWLARNFVYLFATMWSLLSVAYIGLVTFTEVPAENVRHADTILGFVLGTLVAQIIQFFFGSSSGSVKKDETIKQVVKNVTSR